MSESAHVEELLGAYVDGELEGERRRRVELHVLDCTLCAAHLDELRRLDADLRRIATPDPGPAYWSTFTARLESRLPAPAAPGDGFFRRLERVGAWFLPGGRPAWPRLAGAMAAVTLVTYVGINGIRSGDTSLQPISSPRPAQRRELPQPAEGEVAPGAGLALESMAKEADAPPPQPVAGSRDATGPSGQPSAASPAEPPPAAPVPTAKGRSSALSDAPASATPVEEGVLQRDRGADRPAPELAKPQAEAATEWAPLPPPAAAPAPRLAGQSVHGSLPSLQKNEVTGAQVTTTLEAADSALRVFVQAALRGDTLTASIAREAYALRPGAQAVDLAAMHTWLGPHEVVDSGKATKSSFAGRERALAPTGDVAAPLLALDTLVWPRREDPLFRVAIEELARRFAAQAQVQPTYRERAATYLEWVEAHTADPARREAWRRELDLLPR